MTIGAENQAAYARRPETYAQDVTLQRVEREILRRFRHRWPTIRMLDLGIGGGRTTFTFGAIAGSYVGIDYAEPMVALARELAGEDENCRLSVGDARDLADYPDETFDFVLFSFNGIDYVDHNDRQLILREVRRVLASDGTFLFSSHSLDSLPLTVRPLPELTVSAPARSAYRLARTAALAIRLRRSNATLDLAGGKQRGWLIHPDLRMPLGLHTYYVTPRCQIQQLTHAGLAARQILDLAGRHVVIDAPPRDPWLYYVCTRA